MTITRFLGENERKALIEAVALINASLYRGHTVVSQLTVSTTKKVYTRLILAERTVETIEHDVFRDLN